jgi:hypothetical protein
MQIKFNTVMSQSVHMKPSVAILAQAICLCSFLYKWGSTVLRSRPKARCAMWSEQFLALPCNLREGLVAAGLNHVEVMSKAFSADEELPAYEALARQVGYDESDGGQLLYDLAGACRKRSLRTPGRIAAVPDADIEVWRCKKARAERASIAPAAAMDAQRSLKPPPGKAPAEGGPRVYQGGWLLHLLLRRGPWRSRRNEPAG